MGGKGILNANVKEEDKTMIKTDINYDKTIFRGQNYDSVDSLQASNVDEDYYLHVSQKGPRNIADCESRFVINVEHVLDEVHLKDEYELLVKDNKVLANGEVYTDERMENIDKDNINSMVGTDNTPKVINLNKDGDWKISIVTNIEKQIRENKADKEIFADMMENNLLGDNVKYKLVTGNNENGKNLSIPEYNITMEKMEHSPCYDTPIKIGISNDCFLKPNGMLNGEKNLDTRVHEEKLPIKIRILEKIYSDNHDIGQDNMELNDINPSSFNCKHSNIESRSKQVKSNALLKFTHINTNGLERKMEGNITRLSWLLKFSMEKNYPLISVAEHHLKDGVFPNIPTSIFEWHAHNREQSWGGAGILCHKTLGAELLEIPTNGLEVVSIKFIWNSETICFVSVYLPQKHVDEIRLLTEYIEKILLLNNGKVIICGDLNCWVDSIGDSNNHRGKLLFKNLTELGLMFENIPDPTRIGNVNQRDSYVDHIITNCYEDIKSVLVTDKISDHKMLTSAIVGDAKDTDRRIKYDFVNTYKSKSEEINTSFNDYDWMELFSAGDLNELAKNFNQAIINIWNSVGIKKMVNKSSKPEMKPFVKGKLKKMRKWDRKLKYMKKHNLEKLKIEG